MCLLPPNRPSNLPPSLHRGAGNSARSRLSGGFSPISTGPAKFSSCASQSRFHRVLLNIRLNTIKLRIGPDQMVITFVLPKWPMRAQQRVSLVSQESLEKTQPFCGKHVRRDEKMYMIRHDDERVDLVPMQFAIAMQQRRHHDLCDFRSTQEQRARRARIQQPVHGDERLARRDKCRWRKHPVRGETAVQSEGYKQGLVHNVPMRQPPFIMPHTPTWCVGDRETLAALSRLKAGCGQYCPPHGAV